MTIRKYNSEFAVNMRASQILVFQPTFLTELPDDLFTPPYQCHVYGIARRPRVTLDTKSIVISPETIRGDVIAHTQDGPQKYSFEMKNFPSNSTVFVITHTPNFDSSKRTERLRSRDRSFSFLQLLVWGVYIRNWSIWSYCILARHMERTVVELPPNASRITKHCRRFWPRRFIDLRKWIFGSFYSASRTFSSQV